MTWTNGRLTLYHGTDAASAASIKKGIDLVFSKPGTDFGLGFYTTTSLRLAQQLSNTRCLQLGTSGRPPAAAIAVFAIARGMLATLQHLGFVRADDDYWDFVAHCRLRRAPLHGPSRRSYDVVYGPLAVDPPARRLIPDSDQISFHSQPAIDMLGKPRTILRPPETGFFRIS